MLDRTLCPRGCGAEVLVGLDGVVFDRHPQNVLEHPYGEGFSLRTGFRDETGWIHVVRRSQLWFEHACSRAPASPTVESSAPPAGADSSRP